MHEKPGQRRHVGLDAVTWAEQSHLLLRVTEAHHLSGNCKGAKACARRARDETQATGQPYDAGLARRAVDGPEAGRFVDVLCTPL
jgi:hypothetical protein